MLKRGIVTRAGLARPRSWLGARRYASLLLLRDLAAGEAAAEDYATIIRMIRMANGTWRDTFEGRHRSFDERLSHVVAQRRWPAGPLRVVDVGASSGATSVELYETLRRRHAVDFVASDRWRDVFAFRWTRGGPTVVLDGDGNPIQWVAGRFVLPGQGEEPWLYPVNRRLRGRLAARWLAPSQALLARHDLGRLEDFASTTTEGVEVTRLPLLAPACLRCARERPDFRFEVADVLQPLPWRAHVLRAMNVLTPFHFGIADLRTAVGHCLDALAEGGLLVLGRSPSEHPGDLRATIFAREGGELRVQTRTNGGCEIEDLVSEVAHEAAGRALRVAESR